MSFEFQIGFDNNHVTLGKINGKTRNKSLAAVSSEHFDVALEKLEENHNYSARIKLSKMLRHVINGFISMIGNEEYQRYLM